MTICMAPSILGMWRDMMSFGGARLVGWVVAMSGVFSTGALLNVEVVPSSIRASMLFRSPFMPGGLDCARVTEVTSWFFQIKDVTVVTARRRAYQPYLFMGGPIDDNNATSLAAH